MQAQCAVVSRSSPPFFSPVARVALHQPGWIGRNPDYGALMLRNTFNLNLKKVKFIMIRSCHLSFLALLAIVFSTGANAQESRSPSAAEIAQCDQIVHRYHEQKYPEMLAYSDRIMAEGERSVTRHYHIANGRRDSYLAARTDMTAFLSDGHMLPTDRKELLKFTAMRISDYSEDTSDINFALYAAVLGCTGTARLAAMDGRPFVLPKALASLQPSAALNNQSSTESETSTTTPTDEKDYDSCQPALDAQELEFKAINARNPNTQTIVMGTSIPAVVPGLQVLLYMTEKRMKLLNDYCKGQPQYSQYESIKNSHDVTKEVCLKSTSDPSVCKPVLAWK